ncbi:hypothetical protein HY484_00835 [Candidatus Woesearchaeota archaeon]|nr:hypothetical protein [Candidatus Woesearchaeota archaeon]
MSNLPIIPDRETILNEIIRDHLKTKYKLNEQEIEQYFRKEKPAKEPTTIPATIFNDVLSPFETIVKYLKEVKGLRLVEIAKLTGRDQRAIGVTYKAATKKQPEKITPTTTRYTIPLEILNNKTLSVAEHIVKNLKETYELSYHEIAQILKRNDRTVWTLYNRAIKKQTGGIRQ